MRALALAILLYFTALFPASFPAQANEEVVAGLSQNRIPITANFDGSEILIFGAVKRDSAPPEGENSTSLLPFPAPHSPSPCDAKTSALALSRRSISQ